MNVTYNDKLHDNVTPCGNIKFIGNEAICVKTNMFCTAAQPTPRADMEMDPFIMARCPLSNMRTPPRTKEEILAANSRGECLAFVDKYGKMKYISTYGLGLTDDEILDYIKEFIDSGNVFHPEQAISWTQRKEIIRKKTARFRYVFK